MQEEEKKTNDVISFIIQNCEDTELMDKINRITFPFTSKYKDFSKTTQYIPYRKIDRTRRFKDDDF